ncbi:hypothetical protein BDK51DRAFT_34464 [Blyttiomyces helicus]|uniref:Uncharacterized protein n=1 Tax=Blyttiomyces helicus TaxID=388810 RepID=A0A4P9W9D0_9FUNG|nr:hypothetical protein BDK51DRAFT_34464 [Blyttiomyces helicus]|eukprot:RKO88115.1 hypothetical protein BDK51DRAFT_34464 [Blyttiomyces helicus]
MEKICRRTEEGLFPFAGLSGIGMWACFAVRLRTLVFASHQFGTSTESMDRQMLKERSGARGEKRGKEEDGGEEVVEVPGCGLPLESGQQSNTRHGRRPAPSPEASGCQKERSQQTKIFLDALQKDRRKKRWRKDGERRH